MSLSNVSLGYLTVNRNYGRRWATAASSYPFLLVFPDGLKKSIPTNALTRSPVLINSTIPDCLSSSPEFDA